MPKKISKKLFILIIAFQAVGFLFFAPTPMQAADLPKLKNPLDNLQVEIPGLKKLAAEHPYSCQEINGEQKCQLPWIGVYISSLYKYGIGIVGILAAVILMLGGIIWLTAGGNQTRVGEAKAWIGASLTGLIIALTSYMILYQVNPSLTQFRPVEMKIVKGTPTATSTLSGFVNEPSAELSTFINCMQSIPNLRINSVTDTNIAKGSCNPTDPNEQFNSPNNCQHTKFSCHYGGKNDNCVKNGSYAIDVDNNVDGKTIALYAAGCASRFGDYDTTARCILNENGTHHHVSIGPYFNCACDTNISSCASQK